MFENNSNLNAIFNTFNCIEKVLTTFINLKCNKIIEKKFYGTFNSSHKILVTGPKIFSNCST